MDGTSISDLPSSSSSTLPQPIPSSLSAEPTLDQNTIHQLINGIHQASTSGATQLVSRDIPLNTSHLMHDERIKASYIPPPINEKDYIQEQQDTDNIIQMHNKKVNFENTMDDMYNEIQIPLVLGIMYFIFQLPVFKKYLFLYFPFIFSNDGNFNFNGYVFTSFLFGFMYYSINKSMNYFNTF
jgi:hypothetical protein